MNFIKRFTDRFTARGRVLALVEQGMALAKKNESGKAVTLYSKVIDSSETPRDVVAMAMFNRALAFTAIDKPKEAEQDLKAIIAMPESMTQIKKSASDKLVRMKRKIVRESQPSREGAAAPSTDSGGGR